MGITVIALLPTIVLTVVERRAKTEHQTHSVPADAVVEAAV